MHLLSNLFHEFIKSLWILREELAVLLHELVKLLVFTVVVTLNHFIERLHHFFHALHVLGRGIFHRRGNLFKVLLHQLIAQFVHQFFKALLRFSRLKIVRLQFAHLACEVIGQHIHTEVAIHGGITSIFSPPLIAAFLGVHDRLLNGVTLLINDVV